MMCWLAATAQAAILSMFLLFSVVLDSCAAIECYSCKNSLDPKSCQTKISCAGDEYCYTRRILNGNLNSYYDMGCEKQLICGFLGNGAVVGKRQIRREQEDNADGQSRVTRDATICGQCCFTDLCNKDVCVQQEHTNMTSPSSSNDVMVRVLPGSHGISGGVVEVLHGGRWGSVCEAGWTNNDSAVVCYMLGHRHDVLKESFAVPRGISAASTSSYNMMLGDVKCVGTEHDLKDCPHSDWNIDYKFNCRQAGAVCPIYNHYTEDELIFLLDKSKGGTIYRMGLSGNAYTPLQINDKFTPSSFDMDPAFGRIYFTDQILHQVVSTNIDGSDARTLIQLDSGALLEKVAVDRFHSLVFYTDAGNDVIGKMNMDGSGNNNVIQSNLDQPREIVLDPTSKTMYWTDWGAHPKIESATYEGAGRKTLVSQGIVWPNGLTIDFSNKMIYFVDAGTGTLEKMTLQGGSRQEIWRAHNNAHLFAVAWYADQLYYTDWTSGYLNKINSGGTGKTTVGPSVFHELSDIVIYKKNYGLATHSDAVMNTSSLHFDPSRVYIRLAGAVDGHRLPSEGRLEIFQNGQWGTVCDDYWESNAYNNKEVTCDMLGFTSASAQQIQGAHYGQGTGPIILDDVKCTGSESHLISCPFSRHAFLQNNCLHTEDVGVKCSTAKVNGRFTFFFNKNTGQLVRMNLDTYSYISILVPKHPSHGPVAYDSARQLIYFSENLSNPTQSLLRSVDINGVVKTVVTLPGTSINDLDFDKNHDLVVFSDSSKGTISSVNVAGSASNTTVKVMVTGVDSPCSVAVDGRSELVYWSDCGVMSAGIYRASYDGSGRQTLVSSDISLPKGLSLDTSAGLLYFYDKDKHNIESVGVDGRNRRVIYTDTTAELSGLAVTSKFIIFGDDAKPTLTRLYKNNGTDPLPAGPPDFLVDGLFVSEYGFND